MSCGRPIDGWPAYTKICHALDYVSQEIDLGPAWPLIKIKCPPNLPTRTSDDGRFTYYFDEDDYCYGMILNHFDKGDSDSPDQNMKGLGLICK